MLGALTLAAAFASPSRADDYHISPAGDDAAAGSASAPWRTLDRANRHAYRPGDRILLDGGAEFAGNLAVAAPGSSSDPARPITIGSFGRGRAVIRAGRGTAVRIEDLGGVVVRDLVLVGNPGAEGDGFGVLVLHRRPDGARLEGVRVEGVEARGFRWAGIYVGGVPTGLPTFRGREGGRAGFHDVRIRHCSALGNMYYGIYVDGAGKSRATADYANRDVAIVDCVAAENPGDPRYTENHSGNGILVGDTDGVLVERCVAHGNGAANAGRTGGPVGIWAYASNEVTIQSCESYGNRTGGRADGGGFDLDGGVTHSLVQYCYSHDNEGPGFLVWNYEGAPHRLADNVIRYNISAGDALKHGYGGISVGSSETPISNLLVHNNTIFARRVSDGKPPCVRIWARAGKGLTFVNNLFIIDGGMPSVVCESRGEGVRFAGNAYWATDGAFVVRQEGQTFDSPAAWRATTGQERWRGKDVGVFGDPLLSGLPAEGAAGAGDSLTRLGPLRLRAGSPLIDAGLDLAPFSGNGPGGRDFWGTPLPREQRVDIGANEFASSGR